MLSAEEIKELNKLPKELREKILKIFSSPIFLAWRATRSQIETICNELIIDPKSISEVIDIEKYKGLDNVDKIIQALESASRAKSETALKWMKEMPDLVANERSLYNMLTPDEQKAASLFTTTADLRKEALG